MQKGSARSLQDSLVKRLKTSLFLTGAWLIFSLLLSFSAGIVASINQEQLGEQKVVLRDDLNGVLRSMIDQETGLRGYINTNNTLFLEPFNAGRPQYLSYMQHLKDETNTSMFRSTALARIEVEGRASEWYTTFALLQIKNMQRGQLVLARAEKTMAAGKELFDRFRLAVARLQDAIDRDLLALQTQITAIDLLVGAVVAVLSVGAIAVLWRRSTRLTTSLREQLALLEEGATQFGAGHLAARVPSLSYIELSQVGQQFNIMADTLQQQQSALKDRDVLESVLQVQTVLTRSLDLQSLTEEFLSTVLSLLQVQIGVLFLYNSKENHLTLFTAQGVHTEEIPTVFQLGEGTIGRVALTREPLALPPSHIDETSLFPIKTVFGVVLPSSLYHLPLIGGNELLGVLAIGSLYPMNEQARNVLDVLVNNLAVAMSNARAYRHIQDQAEELAQRSREQEQTNSMLSRQRDELHVVNTALEQANRAREQFLATMSHELRTPLTSILAFAQILLRTSDTAKFSHRQKESLESILKNGQHLLSLINDVLDMTKIDSGHMDVVFNDVELSTLLSSIVKETQSLAMERGIKLRWTIDEGLETLETDQRKLRQILLNLVSNGLKFTERGEVIIAARRVPSNEQGPSEEAEQIAIAVKDTGIGIAQEVQKHIFDAFYQVDGSDTRRYGGTGLGLSIVQQLTQLLGGRVEVESSPGQGSTFTVLLPKRAENRSIRPYNLRLHQMSQHPPLEGAPSAENLHTCESGEQCVVLAIDDNPDALRLINIALENSPYKVICVNDPVKAVEVIQEIQPNAVMLDIMMPGVNGWQILHELKSNPQTAAIPVILLTVLEERGTAYILGADDYLVKPIERDVLLKTLQHFTSRATSAASRGDKEMK